MSKKGSPSIDLVDSPRLEVRRTRARLDTPDIVGGLDTNKIHTTVFAIHHAAVSDHVSFVGTAMT
jgi:hypothetical protein